MGYVRYECMNLSNRLQVVIMGFEGLRGTSRMALVRLEVEESRLGPSPHMIHATMPGNVPDAKWEDVVSSCK